ncbi:hypothetical protein [uncultured Acinetobacter sp.]|uniref:hypothetical protein n=1 Tax=uncultured Acinetobacter sp. TaxID=165433 RepID=UPI00258CFC5A|nr:hypothetical protein [uncultured Acinetobacter sp.]
MYKRIKPKFKTIVIWLKAFYAESDFDAFMWYGQTFQPEEHRYELPLLSSVPATKVCET